jgi:hypothetical protein
LHSFRHSRESALLSGEIRDGIVAVESTAVLLGLNPREARAFSDFSVGSAGAGERRGQSGTRLRHSGVGLNPASLRIAG